MEFIFWADSYDKTIKRSFMINAKDGEVKMGYAQDLNMKGNSKPTGIAVDWVAENLYWTETDHSGNKLRGRVMVAKQDGRFHRSLVMTGLESPTSVALDPQLGHMFWADAGAAPTIETAWMDGSKRRPIVTDGIRHPTGLVVDYAMDHTLYWADTKLNYIVRMRQDGSNRLDVLKGGSLHHPISLDVFESSLYWVNRDNGELVRQDKFGRGVPVIVAKDIESPSGVKVYHKLRYNMSLINPCYNSPCSHLCVIVPGGHKCMCPDNTQTHIGNDEVQCDAPNEEPYPEPRICRCQNGGVCQEADDGSNDLVCDCPKDFAGRFCGTYVKHSREGGSGHSTATIVVSIAVVLLVLASAVALFIVLRKHSFGKAPDHGALTNSLSVSFRQGTNVEFGSPAFADNGPQGTRVEPIDAEYNKHDIAPKNRDFSNPMYDGLGNVTGGQTGNGGSGGGIYEVPADAAKSKIGSNEEVDMTPELASALLAPSSIIQKSPETHIRLRELVPTSTDTGKDTQKLLEEDKSEF